MADFEEEKPYLTEEELFQTVKDSIAAYRKTLEQETEQYSASVYVSDIDTHFSGDDGVFYPAAGKYPFTFLPLRNTEGGSTAVAIAYCAVNGSTKRKEKVRDVLDVLLSEALQKDSRLYRMFNGMAVNRNLSGMTSSIAYGSGADFSGRQLETWHRVCEDINIVRFLSPLDTELNAMMEDIEDAMGTYRNEYNPDYIMRDGRFMSGSISDEKIKEIISGHYQNMQRLLDES